MERLTARSSKNNLAYLVKVKKDEQDVQSLYPNTLKAILESFQRLAEYEDTDLTPAKITALKAENAELRKRCEAALSDLKGDCASCAKKGKNVNVCRKCIDSETYDEYKWRGEEGETDAND